ncbi:MAG: NUDIX hydrolase [Blastopirellula sp.]|nr:NUDIX hydrolase [Blastopirellula sp.]|tara:strand:- start:58 stop:750 length:693 start_codon:yes stop_codon:yes gene_type:complete
MARHTYDYPRPCLTVDCVVFGLDETALQVLLIQRAIEPHAGCWALPGGFVEMGESLEAAARRELQEETSLDISYLEQLYTFGGVDRDPRDRVVTVAYYALVKRLDHVARASSDARQVGWFPVNDLPPLAFDHEVIMAAAHERLRGKVRYQPIGFELLPTKFTLRQLQHVYETILDRALDKRNFRKKILSMDLLIELDETEQGVAHRAARLYRFDRRKYERLSKRGFLFEI